MGKGITRKKRWGKRDSKRKGEKKSTDMGDEKRETDRESEWCIEKEKGHLKEMEMGWKKVMWQMEQET